MMPEVDWSWRIQKLGELPSDENRRLDHAKGRRRRVRGAWCAVLFCVTRLQATSSHTHTVSPPQQNVGSDSVHHSGGDPVDDLGEALSNMSVEAVDGEIRSNVMDCRHGWWTDVMKATHGWVDTMWDHCTYCNVSMGLSFCAVYKGFGRDGVPHGEGMLTFPSGVVHEGTFVDGVPHGGFTLTYPSGVLKVIHVDGKRCLPGAWYYETGRVPECALSKREGIYVVVDGCWGGTIGWYDDMDTPLTSEGLELQQLVWWQAWWR